MTNRDLLKEAIADAKAVKEVAITNAKAALEEAFTPHLKEMFEKKMMDMEKDEEEVTTEANDDKELEELFRELEGSEGDVYEAKEEESEEEAEEDDAEEADEEDAEEEDAEEEEEIDLEDMTEEDLKKFIEDVVDEMIEAGELEAGHEGMEDEAGAMEEPEMGPEEMPAEEEAPMMENKKTLKEVSMSVDILDLILGTLGTLGGIIGGAFAKASYDEKREAAKKLAQAIQSGEGDEEGKSNEMPAMEAELTEAINTINVLKSELSEINLLNSKLLYTNKIFKAKNLTESQKVKVLTAFDKAETVKEVKLVFETLNEGLEKANKKELVRENKGFASKAIGVSPKQPVVEANDMVNRFKKLAGL